MTIHDLIERLKVLPPSTPVYIDGYEGGLEDLLPSSIYMALVRRHANPSLLGAYGPHEAIWPGEGSEVGPDGELPSWGLVLARGARAMPPIDRPTVMGDLSDGRPS